jgi:N-acetylglucosamine-6-phosphate deacetylase
MRAESEPSRRRFLATAAGAFAAGPGASRAGERGATDAAGVRSVELPGLVDLQVNGFAGVDFGDPATTPDDVERAVAAIQKTGVTRFLPTLITSPFETFAACAQTLLKTRNAAVAGIHMEGPYISPEDGPRGAHARAHVRAAELDDFKRRQDAADGTIRLVTVAPESPGAIALVERLVAGGLRVAIGHTAASGTQIQAAVAAGATLSTHLGNGCAGMLPRHPNVIWEQLGEDRLLASFIVDGHHLPPATVRSMVRAKTPARTILVTDAMAAAGMPPGVYTIGGQKVELDASGRVAAPGASNLAGSALTLSAAVGHAVRFTGLPLDDVVEMASGRPAGYLGIPPAGRVTAEWDPAASELRILSVSL